MYCETLINVCASVPCINNATCSQYVPGTYTCKLNSFSLRLEFFLNFTNIGFCPAGYTGNSCNTLINYCSSNPCKNNGLCIQGVNSYTCSCKIGKMRCKQLQKLFNNI